MKTREESREEAVEIMRLASRLIHLSGFVLLANPDRGCAVLMDTRNNEEFCFSAGGELLDEQ